MAIAIHVARIGMIPTNALGGIIDKNTATLKEVAEASTEPRILEDALIPNSTNSPTLKEYLVLEAAGDFVLSHIDQTFVITYDQGGVNSAT